MTSKEELNQMCADFVKRLPAEDALCKLVEDFDTQVAKLQPRAKAIWANPETRHAVMCASSARSGKGSHQFGFLRTPIALHSKGALGEKVQTLLASAIGAGLVNAGDEKKLEHLARISCQAPGAVSDAVDAGTLDVALILVEHILDMDNAQGGEEIVNLFRFAVVYVERHGLSPGEDLTDTDFQDFLDAWGGVKTGSVSASVPASDSVPDSDATPTRADVITAAGAEYVGSHVLQRSTSIHGSINNELRRQGLSPLHQDERNMILQPERQHKISGRWS